MLSHVGLPKAEDTESSRRYLFGSTVIVDSISASRIEEACSLITTYFSDFIEVDKLPVAPSPLLQEYMLCQPAWMMASPSQRTASACPRSCFRLLLTFQLFHIHHKTSQLTIIPRSLRLLLAIIHARGRSVDVINESDT